MNFSAQNVSFILAVQGYTDRSTLFLSSKQIYKKKRVSKAKQYHMSEDEKTKRRKSKKVKKKTVYMVADIVSITVVACEQMRRSACTSVQSDQRLCYSLSEKQRDFTC